ncbi:MAG: hypothetical protein OXQ90_01970 [Gammaproteobacteria bacterium]|nr:hypothetical protein [Gammaproteobacteria bacterium]
MNHLGYDPRPDVKRWRGTPIPSVEHPLALTSERRTIAERVWWIGPPWTILRNARRYLWSVMDFGTDDDIAYTRTDVERELWVLALRTAKPGQVSRGSWILFSIAYGLIANTADYIGACRQEWPETAHKRDWRMLSGAPRETLYAHQAMASMLARGYDVEAALDAVADQRAAGWRRTPGNTQSPVADSVR